VHPIILQGLLSSKNFLTSPIFLGTVGILVIAGLFKIFIKAGKPGWPAFIPIYNIIVLLQVIGRPLWWVIATFIPFINIVVGIIIGIDLAKSFGKGPVFGIGITFLSPIFLPILGFSDAQYLGKAS
jgi:hypothetical protein